MKKYIQIGIRTKIETSSWDVGDVFLASLENSGISPEQVSNNADKFTDKFLSRSESEKYWSSPAILVSNGIKINFYQDFAWRRKHVVRSSGYVVHRKLNLKSQIVPGIVNFRSDIDNKVDFYLLFRQWCEIFQPQIAMLHLFSELEVNKNNKNDSFQIGSFNSLMKPEIPDMAWAMFYSEEFFLDVDFKKIYEAGFLVEKINFGYLIRVTNSIENVFTDFKNFSDRRIELKKFFHKDMFLSGSNE